MLKKVDHIIDTCLSGRFFLGILGSLMVTTWGVSFFMLTKYPLLTRDECWFSEVAYYFLKHGSFNSAMFAGLREAVGGWVGHGVLYFWVDSLSFYLFGPGLFQARLPVFVVSFGILACLFLIAKHLYTTRVAFIAVVIISISRVFFWTSHVYMAHIFLVFIQVLCVYLFLQFKDKKNMPLISFLIGILAVSSFEVHWIGTIIPVTMLVLYLVEYKFDALKHISVYLFLLGCGVSFAGFLYLRLVVIGWDLFFYKFELYYQMGEAVSYFKSMCNEFIRYKLYFRKYHIFELLPMGISALYFLKNKKTKNDYLLLSVILTYIVLLAFVVKNKNPYFILYFPFFYILMAAVIDRGIARVSNTKLLAKIPLLLILLIIPYFMFYVSVYTVRNRKADFNGFVKTLKQYIPPDSAVMGHMHLWYGFSDYTYYENLHYIERALGRDRGFNDLKGTDESLYVL